MASTVDKVNEISQICDLYGDRDIIVLSGAPATGKSYLSRLIAEKVGGHQGFVERIQFHPGFSYEDFMEGLRPRPTGGYEVTKGIFLQWNHQADKDRANRYVLVLEEFSRADLPSVLGELMTFVEHRGEQFVLPISREKVTVASNLVLLATMNPRDRSALDIDEAMIRRLRIIDCLPDLDQLKEMLAKSLEGEEAEKTKLIGKITKVFTDCESEFPDTYEAEMPFGHGIFDGLKRESELSALWDQKIKRILYRSQGLTHPFADVIQTAIMRQS